MTVYAHLPLHAFIVCDLLTEQGLTSHQTHYRSYRGRGFTGQM